MNMTMGFSHSPLVALDVPDLACCRHNVEFGHMPVHQDQIGSLASIELDRDFLVASGRICLGAKMHASSASC